MSKLIIPKDYYPVIPPMETQRAIKKIKDYFQQELAYGLSLRRVSAPIFVDPLTGLNDNLSGVERKEGGGCSIPGKMEENGYRKVWH